MKPRPKEIIFLLSFILTQLVVSAQGKKPLTMAEAVQLSIQNSKQLKVNQAKIDQAVAATKQAEQKKLPDASVSGSYLHLNNPNIDLKTKSSSSGGSTTGGGTPKVSQAVYGIVNGSMPIYAGGRIRYGIESAKFLEQAVRLDAANDHDAVVQNTIEGYVNLYKAESYVGLVKQSLLESQERVKQFSNLEKNGLLARNDLLKAQLQSSNVELTLLDAENNWQLANVNMDLMLGLPDSTEIVPDSTGVSKYLSTVPVKTLDEYLQSAMQNRKDIMALGMRQKASESGTKAVRGEYYPSLAVTGGYIAADIPNFLSVTNAVNIGLGVSYNIGSLWKTKAKVQEAEARTREISANEDLLNDRIRLEVNQAYLNWLSSQKKIEVNAKAVDQADEAYRVIKNKYNNSLATTTDLLDADVAQLQARLSFVSAQADAVVAYNKLLQTAGLIENNK
jgi:outer membrane protein